MNNLFNGDYNMECKECEMYIKKHLGQKGLDDFRRKVDKIKIVTSFDLKADTRTNTEKEKSKNVGLNWSKESAEKYKAEQMKIKEKKYLLENTPMN